MKITFTNKRLGLLETEEASKTGLPVAVIKSARKKFQVIRAAPDERTLRNWKSLHYEKLSGDREGQCSVRLNDSWRVVFHLDKSCQPHEITVIEIINYHK